MHEDIRIIVIIVYCYFSRYSCEISVSGILSNDTLETKLPIVMMLICTCISSFRLHVGYNFMIHISSFPLQFENRLKNCP